MSGELIRMIYETNGYILGQTVAGLSHADSLLQPPFKANCLNWVVGHVVNNRNWILSLLGLPPVIASEKMAPYKRGAAPVQEGAAVVQFAELLAAYEQSQIRIMGALKEISAETLASPTTNGRSLAHMLAFLGWHEGYHIGQTDLLRQLAGKNDQVIP